MNRRRTRLEMYFDVLMAIKGGNRMGTRIMNEANISWRTLNRILTSLKSQEIITEVQELNLKGRRMRKLFEFTPKGEGVMRYLRDHTQLLTDSELWDFY
ncbi:MAG TPA: winged helix-turn-helix domain-containing protein [Patescibacteria group bacterium]|nr:winged helix-turn-helix domain-containing protein [Patescibacteria group bacterium]